jgi:hypothetical protein
VERNCTSGKKLYKESLLHVLLGVKNCF